MKRVLVATCLVAVTALAAFTLHASQQVVPVNVRIPSCDPSTWTVAPDPAQASISAGTRLRFQLIANSVVDEACASPKEGNVWPFAGDGICFGKAPDQGRTTGAIDAATGNYDYNVTASCNGAQELDPRIQIIP